MRPEQFTAMTAVLIVACTARAADEGTLQPKPEPNDHWSESFTFLADLEDGTYVWTQLSFTNLGPGSGNGSCRVLVLRPPHRAFTASAWGGRTEWRYVPGRANSSERLDVVRGRCFAEGGKYPRVRAALEGRTVEIRFAQTFRPIVPPGASLTLSSGFYFSEVLFPFGAVQVFLSGKDWAPDEQPERLTGGGYADHSRSTVTPPELAVRWLRFRALLSSPRTTLLGREAPDGSFGPVYEWKEGQEPQELAGFALVRQGSKEDTTWQAEVPGAGVLRTTALLHRSAPVEELGLLGALVRPVVGSPVTYTYRAVLERRGAPPLPGLMEVSLERE
jgi:hypothetical protein